MSGASHQPHQSQELAFVPVDFPRHSREAEPTMSRSTLDGAQSAAGTTRRGRHRMDNPAGVRCSDLPGVRERLPQTRRGTTFLRALLPSVATGRHTWDFLANAGGRPRTAFAIILSL